MRRISFGFSRAVRGRTRSLATAGLIAVFVVVYLILAWRQPHGRWDAIAMWNLRARIMAFGNSPMRGIWLPHHYPHPDYPPLQPAIIALGWRLAGDTFWVPILLHGAVLTSILWLLRGKLWAVALVGTVAVAYAPWQYADLPLALTLLGATVAYRQHALIWTGIALGFGLLIKNEGTLIAVAYLLALALYERNIPWRTALAILPFVMVLIAFKSGVPANDVMSAGGAFERLVDPLRWLVVMLGVTLGILSFGGGAILLLSFGIWLTNTPLKWSAPLVAVAFIWIGYVVIYLITPHDLVWHIETSYDRLLLHLFPTVAYWLSLA